MLSFFSTLVVVMAFDGEFSFRPTLPPSLSCLCLLIALTFWQDEPGLWSSPVTLPCLSPRLYCPWPSLIPPSYYNCSQRGTRRASGRATEDGDRDWRGTEVSHFKEQVKVSCCMIIRSGEGDGSSLHRLRKHVCVTHRESVCYVAICSVLIWFFDYRTTVITRLISF